ncbi:MAG: hypothetical protein OXC10_19730 [Rhodospirillaceae bacterium]|nr:hypothetical protein [Rhodospirillaceae bacterium]
MDQVDAAQLYWSGGPFRVRLASPPGRFSSEALAKAVAVLEEFRAECHKSYFAFNGTLNGRLNALNAYREFFTSRSAMISAGTTLPDGEQRPGHSVIAQLTQGGLIDSLVEGVDFEDRQNKALVVMLYHRWDEWYRYRIGEVLGLRKHEVQCTLMGEVRRLRNLIVHENSLVPDDFSVPILSRVWGGIGTGYLVITDRMVHALMEQFNAILVEAG